MQKYIQNVTAMQCTRPINLLEVDAECHQNNKIVTLTAEDIINQPPETEPTSLEKQAACNVVTRLMSQSEDNVLRLHTGED